ncbi:MAG TPA: hypothetical protein ENK53_07385 [Thiotrichales bacterium]|nr:hypothetical protein [Thiotrichales bacterium]
MELLKCELFPRPPLQEQSAIVEYIEKQTNNITRTAEATRREIALLRELRTRLIADVVTGKLDVREVAERLPDEDEEPEPLDEAEDDSAGEELADDIDPVPEEAEA